MVSCLYSSLIIDYVLLTDQLPNFVVIKILHVLTTTTRIICYCLLFKSLHLIILKSQKQNRVSSLLLYQIVIYLSFGFPANLYFFYRFNALHDEHLTLSSITFVIFVKTYSQYVYHEEQEQEPEPGARVYVQSRINLNGGDS